MAIALVQEAFSMAYSGSISISTPAAGSTLLMLHFTTGAGISAVSGGGVTWSFIGSGSGLSFWAGANSTGSGSTVSVTKANYYGANEYWVSEFSGMATTLTLDASGEQSGTNPTNQTPSVTPTAGQAMLLIAASSSYPYGVGNVSGGGFTAFGRSGASGNATCAYQIADPTSGSYQCSWSAFNGYGTNYTGLYVFAGGGGGGQPAIRRFGGVGHANFRCGSEGVKMWRVQPRQGGLIVPDRSLVIPQPEMRIAS